MSAQSTTLEGRTAAEALMVDACVVRRVTGRVLDQTTLEYVETTVTLYEGRCRVRPSGARGAARDAVAGEHTVTLREYIVSLPLEAEGVRVSDVVEVTASELDPTLPGTRMRVFDSAKGSTITARRFPCEEVTS